MKTAKRIGSRGSRIVERRKLNCREWLTVLPVAGELPARDIVKPDVSDERLKQLREMARQVLDEDETD